MQVSQAIANRRSVRAFTDTPVETALLKQILLKAQRAPSGGNVQPWQIYLINGEAMTRFKSIMKKRLSGETYPGGEAPEHPVYPPKLKEPYRSARFEVGEMLYGLLGIAREDKPARREWFNNNYMFFGAPAAIFCFMDRSMVLAQWADCGMYLQTVMLLLEEAGLQSCAQGCWFQFPKTVAEFCGAPDEHSVFCGMAIGHEDKSAAVNKLVSKRFDEGEWLTVV